MVVTKSCGNSNLGWFSEGEYLVPFLAPIPVLVFIHINVFLSPTRTGGSRSPNC